MHRQNLLKLILPYHVVKPQKGTVESTTKE